MNIMVIEQHDRGLFITRQFGDPAFQRCEDIDLVGIKAMLGYFFMASPIKNATNARFCHDLKIRIQEHPNQYELEAKRPKLEALGFKF